MYSESFIADKDLHCKINWITNHLGRKRHYNLENTQTSMAILSVARIQGKGNTFL